MFLNVDNVGIYI